MSFDLSECIRKAEKKYSNSRNIYTEEQEEALALIKNWYYSDDRQVFKLTGLAGTGKTYLISHLEEELDCSILYLAYTGKASNNLSVKGLESRTIHSVLYRPTKDLCEPSDSLLSQVISELGLKCSMESCKSRLLEAFSNSASEKVLKFVRKDSSQEEIPSLIVIDEASMVSRVIYTDLMELDVKILLCGDPGQLPPIETDKTWSALSNPDYTLTNIQRQQEDNPIIQLAHKIYNWNIESLEYNAPSQTDSGMCLILNKQFGAASNAGKHIEDLMLQAEQVLCFTNKYRAYANDCLRKRKGFTKIFPQPGDKLICAKNNWRLVTDDVPLVNGQIGECISFDIKNRTCDKKSYPVGVLEFMPDYTTQILKVQISLNPFLPKEERIPEDVVDYLKLNKFEYGYAITVHKAQGSEWDSVFAVYDSNITVDHLKEWLYTALTRARNQVILYLPKVNAIENIRKIYPKD